MFYELCRFTFQSGVIMGFKKYEQITSKDFDIVVSGDGTKNSSQADTRHEGKNCPFL